MAVFTGNGSASSPSFTFSSDTTTGIFRPETNTVAITTNGVERFRIDSEGGVVIANEQLNNITVGAGSGQFNTNTAVGRESLLSNTTGDLNTAVGNATLRNNTTGSGNTAFGTAALLCNINGSENTAVGRGSLRNNSTGTENASIGAGALGDNTIGNENTAIGRNALRDNIDGCFNTASGTRALFNSISGSNNVAVGHSALRVVTTGSNNIGIGVNAGRTGTGLSPQGITNINTQSNRIVMGNDEHTCAQIKIAWTATSDCRDKTCFAPVPHGLNFVRALKPTEYRFRYGGRESEIPEEKRRYGFLAQDILPLEGDDPVIISTEDPDKLQYTEAHLIPVLVKAIQELAQRVEELENA